MRPEGYQEEQSKACQNVELEVKKRDHPVCPRVELSWVLAHHLELVLASALE
jgi:ribosomal protein S27AE